MNIRFVLCGGIVTVEAMLETGICRDEASRPYKTVACCYMGTRSAFGMGASLASDRSVFQAWGASKVWMTRPGRFLEDIRQADIVYLAGGDTPTLIAALKKEGVTAATFKGKSVLANSAGVGALTYASYNVDHGRVITGLNIIPALSIVHYDLGANDISRIVGETPLEWPKVVQELRHALKPRGSRFQEIFLASDQHKVVVVEDQA